MTAWNVFYSDGTTISSEQATPSSINPRDRVQVIVQTNTKDEWVTVPPSDYYMWDARGGKPQWFGGDREGLSTYIRQPGSKYILIGEWIDKYKYREIFNKAKAWMDYMAGESSINPNHTVLEAEFKIPEGTPVGSVAEYFLEE